MEVQQKDQRKIPVLALERHFWPLPSRPAFAPIHGHGDDDGARVRRKNVRGGDRKQQQQKTRRFRFLHAEVLKTVPVVTEQSTGLVVGVCHT